MAKLSVLAWRQVPGRFLRWGLATMVLLTACSRDDKRTPPTPTARLMVKAAITPLPGTPMSTDFVLQNLQGHPLRLSEQKGKVVVLNFWTTWCGSCKIEKPYLVKLHQRFKERDFVFLAVNYKEPRQRVQAYVQKNNLDFPIILDTKGHVGLAFGVRSLPTTFIIDKSGRLMGKAIGSREWSDISVTTLIEHLVDMPEAPVN